MFLQKNLDGACKLCSSVPTALRVLCKVMVIVGNMVENVHELWNQAWVQVPIPLFSTSVIYDMLLNPLNLSFHTCKIGMVIITS